MQLTLGQKIRELRHRDGRTQENLAEALGVTSQAVSRWEANGGYPDMEMLPSIANYFHISIDELFGYNADREEKINAIIEKAYKALKKQGRIIVGSVLEDITESADMLRTASEEFPNEPKILLKLAQTLNLLGYNKYGAKGRLVDCDGIIEENIEFNMQNKLWHESIKAYEKALRSNPSPKDRTSAILQLTPLYCRMGQYEKAKALASQQNELAVSKEMLLPLATGGIEKAKYEGERIIALISNLRFAIYQSVALRPVVSESNYKKQILLSLINLYETVFSDGRYGIWHSHIGQMYIDLSKHESMYGDIQNALDYFEKGFRHYDEYQRVLQKHDYVYSAPLIYKVKSNIDNSFIAIDSDFWKKELKLFPEHFCNELRKNCEYSICFE